MKDLKKVIYIHAPRTAGTSISTALGLYNSEYRHFFARKHIAIRSNWDSYFKVAFVRNPWDRAVSIFSHQTKGEGDFKIWLMEMVRKDGHPKDRSQEWKLSDTMRGTGGTGIPWKCQSDWLIDNNGEICMDFVGRFEGMEWYFKKLCDILDLNCGLPHMNKTNRKPYVEYYDNITKQIVADWHRKDLENFGYTFDKPIAMI